MITIVNVLTFTTGGVLGYLLRTLIDHRLARSRSIEAIQITEFNKTAATFRDTLIEHKVFLQDLVSQDIYADHIGFNITDIELAKNAFEFYLSNEIRPAFNKAWDNYKNYEKYYSDEVHDKKPSLTCNDLEKCRLQLIDVLLGYATPILKK
jgi:hypothetical protein